MSVEEVLLNPKEQKIKELDQLIKQSEVELKYIEDFIFSSNDARLIYLCGKHIEWINKGRLAHALSRTLDDYYILNFAMFIQGLNDITIEEKKKVLNELGKGMIRSKGTHNVYYYARNILNAPVDKLAETLAKSNDATYIFYMLRDLKDKLSEYSKEKLERRILELKNSRYIVCTASIATVVSIEEYATSLLEAKKDDCYGVHLCMFLQNHHIPKDAIRSKFIETLMKTNDYLRIIDLIKKSDCVSYTYMIDYMLEEKDNYKNPDFWLNYIIPIAICNKPCSLYAVDKIIENKNVEIITIAIYYMENEKLRQKLQESLNKIPNLDEEYRKTTLSSNVLTRVRTILKKEV